MAFTLQHQIFIKTDLHELKLSLASLEEFGSIGRQESREPCMSEGIHDSSQQVVGRPGRIVEAVDFSRDSHCEETALR